MKLWPSRAKPVGRLPALLRAYPPYCAPHVGPGASLTPQQASENLGYLLSNLPDRLACIASLLSEFDLHVPSKGSDPYRFLDKLHRWTLREWPGIADDRLRSVDDWLHSERAGPEIVFSMLMDLSILLGEIVISRQNRFRWSLDLDPSNRAMASYRRPVVLKAPDIAPIAIMLDIESIVVGHYFKARSPAFGALNEFEASVSDALSGAHERYWVSPPTQGI